MRKVKIVADSSADLLSLLDCEFAYSPMKVIAGETEFVDDDGLDVNEMVAFFDRYKGKSQSSCPNTGDWLEAFGDADDVFCVTITSGLSGSYNAACAAKQLYESENKGKRVFVLDSLSAGPEVRLHVEKLADYIKEGLDYDEICKKIADYREHTGLVFMLKSLKNFANNGRVSPTVAKLAGFLGICIVGKASEEGTLEPSHKCRGESRSLEKMVSDIKDQGFVGGRVRITHCMNDTAAFRLKEMIENSFKTVQVEIHEPRGLCCFYMERGGVLLGFEKE